MLSVPWILRDMRVDKVPFNRLYQGLSNKQVCKAVIKLGFVMAKPAGCPTDIYKIMVQCWQKEPKDRPSFSEIVALLEQLPSTR
eukprot:m.282016 g.282016  ORF g.282016 m.282016 type:complete len:84 (+) comp16183_c0_seq2:5769-6020(+)